MPVFLGLLAGLSGAAGLALANGFLALGSPEGALAWTAFAVGCLAALGATAPGHPQGRRAALLTAVACGVLLPWLARPNGSFEVELGIDRFLLLPRIASLAGDLCYRPLAWALALPLAAAGAGLVLALEARRRLVARCLLGAVVASFLVAATFVNPQVDVETARAPEAGSYAMDAFMYLRTGHLMHQGSGYYRAFYLAFTQRKGEEMRPETPFDWRTPAFPYLWLLVPGGPRELLLAFRILVALGLVVSFAIARTRVDEGLALVAPVLLSAYFLYPAGSIWFGTHEYWASLLMLGGIWGWVTRRPAAWAVLFALAFACREHFGFLVVPLLYAFFRGEGRERPWAAGALVAVLAFYLGHYFIVSDLVTPGNRGLTSWLSGGPAFLLECLQFGTVFVAARKGLWLPLLALGVASACLEKEARTRVLLASSVLLPLAVFLFVGQPYRSYWGPVAVPQILLAVPLVGSLGRPRDAAQEPPSEEG